MPRPRQYSLDDLLDAAERLVVEGGREALTVRALSRSTGASNGAIYHSFGNLETVLARLWLRRAEHFLAVQRDLVDQARATAPAEVRAVAAVVAAADALGAFGVDEPVTARLLTSVQRDALLTEDLDEDLISQLRALDTRVTALMRGLAEDLWQRFDGAAAEVLATCVVRLPAALLFPSLRRGRPDPLAREHLRAAVEAVLALHPTCPPSRGGHLT